MPVSFEFLRGTLGIIGLGCAYMAGRSLLLVRKGWLKLSKLYGWLIRAFVCLSAIVFRHPVDTMAVVIWCLSAVAFGLAYWQAAHQKPPEDLSRQMFQ
ncbi:MAG TPA: hypothetical protein VMH28_25770 [Candidatus Acidoferrales bacterium]|nr:hypothetical protein [Candidatus Acidoferrales bacterium]